ncbi:hypothetical protein DXG01_007588 [Tephrocybe rancida]|nr:hypothetical protein DXG01_007588 [Tephrocybe rancida]
MSVEAGNRYVLVNVKSETALDLSGTDGSSILGWNQHDRIQWELKHYEGTNQWTFRNVGSGKFLGLAEQHLRDDVPLRAVEHPVPWDISRDDRDQSVYRIFVPGTPFNVDLTNNGDSNNGTLVAIWGKWEGVNQTWRFHQGE